MNTLADRVRKRFLEIGSRDANDSGCKDLPSHQFNAYINHKDIVLTVIDTIASEIEEVLSVPPEETETVKLLKAIISASENISQWAYVDNKFYLNNLCREILKVLEKESK